MTASPGDIERLQTGIESVYEILHGGIPKYAATVVTGGPGSGKTVFTLQTIFNNARKGMKAIYFTTLSEPAPKLIRYTRWFDFFDESLVGNQVKFMDIGTQLRTGGPSFALEEIERIVEEEQPDIIAVDSFKAIHDLAPDPENARLFTYDLAAHLAIWSVTTFLVGEYTLEDVAKDPEFAVADSILFLSQELEKLRGLRELQVMKLRGSGFNPGRHFFDITRKGFHAYPRVGTVGEDEHATNDQRVSTGIPGLDQMLHGGLLAGSSTLIEGATGVGKTLLGMNFVAEGARNGEKCILFAFEERPAQIRQVAKGIGLDLSEGSGVIIDYTNPVEMLGPRWLDRVRDLVRDTGATRVVIDSVSSMRHGMMTDELFLDLIYTTVKMFRSMGVSLLMTQEIHTLLGMEVISGVGLSSISDNIIILRYVEVESRLDRAISVLKSRGSSHETELRKYNINGTGVEVDGPFKQMRGVLSGIPTQAE